MRKIKKNLENVEKIFYTFMQIVNIIFGGKLFRFFWILYGEIGGFSSLFTLYGYYTLCFCMYTSFYKIWIIQWMKNLWILNDWWIYKHYFYYWRGNFNFSLCFFFLLFFFISSLYLYIYSLIVNVINAGHSTE